MTQDLCVQIRFRALFENGFKLVKPNNDFLSLVKVLECRLNLLWFSANPNRCCQLFRRFDTIRS